MKVYVITLALLIIVLSGLAVLHRAMRNGAVKNGTSITNDKNSIWRIGRTVPGMIDLQKTKIDYINEDFNDIYFLDEKQILKYVPPPYSDERMDYFVRERGHNEDDIESATFWWHNGQLELRNMLVGYYPIDRTLERVLRDNLKMNNYQIENWNSIPNIPLVGDWIIRKGTSLEQQLADLSRCIKESVGSVITFEKKKVKREVLVTRSLHNLQPLSGQRYTISVYLNKISTKESHGGGTGTVYKFLHSLSNFLDIPIINEVGEYSDPVISWVYYIDNYYTFSHSLENRITRKILDNVSEQLPIEFTKEIREIDVWSVK